MIRVDARGFGLSPPASGAYSLVGDALAVLDQLGVDDAHLVGLSQGAATSVDVALGHPARVRSLTLIAPGLSGYEWPELPGHAERVEASERGDAVAVVESEIRLWAPLSVGPDGLPVNDPAVRMMMDLVGNVLLDDLAVAEPSAVERLGEIGVPTLVVLGDRDLDVITAIGDLLTARIPGARRVLLIGADHLVPLRLPTELAGLLAGHLD